MKSGTAIGLFVGGAVLLIATAPRGAQGAAPAYASPGGALNPLNWFSQPQGYSAAPGGNILSSLFAPQSAPAAAGGYYQPSTYVQPAPFGGADGFYSGSNGAGLIDASGNYIPNAGGIFDSSGTYNPGGGGLFAGGYTPDPSTADAGAADPGATYADYWPVMLLDGSYADGSQLAPADQEQMASFDSGGNYTPSAGGIFDSSGTYNPGGGGLFDSGWPSYAA